MTHSKLIKAVFCASVGLVFTGCGKDKKSANKAQEVQINPGVAEDLYGETIRSAEDEEFLGRQGVTGLPTCFEYCGGGECVMPSGGSGLGYCAVNGQIIEEAKCGADVCQVERSELDCHDYCKEGALSAMVDDQYMPYMSTPQQMEGNVKGAYTGYCSMESADGQSLAFPQCSGSQQFCTANQCNLAAAKQKQPKAGEMCAYSWEGSSFSQAVTGAAATVVVQYSGPMSGWVIYSMGCEYQTAEGHSSGYKVTGPTQVSQCLNDVQAGISKMPTLAQYNRIDSFREFGIEMHKLDFTLPAQASLSNILRGSQHMISCAQVLLKLNSQYTFNFLTSFDGGVTKQATTTSQQSVNGFRPVSGVYSVSNFESRAVTVMDYMLMYKEVGTKLSAMCFQGFNPVQSFCTERSTCRADGLLAKQNTVVLEKDLVGGGNYRISGLECADLQQRRLDFDSDRASWNKINLFLGKYLGSVPQDRKRLLLKRIQTSFHSSLAGNMMSVAEMEADRLAFTEEVKAELESTMGLSRFIADSEDEDSQLSTCSRVFQDWAASEDMQYYVGERLNAELQTSRADAFNSHHQSAMEQKKMDAAKRIYSRVLGHNLFESLSPVFAQSLDRGQTLSANNDAGLMADILCNVAVKAIDEPSTVFGASTETCAFTSPSIEGAENTLYISQATMSSMPDVRNAVAQTKMEFIRRRMSVDDSQFNEKVNSMLKKKKIQKKRHPREIVHGSPSESESDYDDEDMTYDIRSEKEEGVPYVMEIVGVTCGARAGDASPVWRQRTQSFSVTQIIEKCRQSDIFVSWGEEGPRGALSLRERFESLVNTPAGRLQVVGNVEEHTGDFDGDFCQNIGSNMFSNFQQLSQRAFSERADAEARRTSKLVKTDWSKFLSDAIPRVYAENQGPTSQSQVLDAPMAADVLCTIAWGCDLLPATLQ